MVATSCGRIGFDSLPQGGKGLGGASGAVDASTDAGRGSGGVSEASASGGANGGGGAGGALASGGTSGTGGTGGVPDSGAPDSGGSITDGSTDSGTALDGSLPIQPIADLCLEIPELPAAPTIDGRLERGLALRAITPVDWNQAGTPDAAASYAIAWTATGLYFFVSVQDPAVIPADAPDPVWYGDGVELYVDSDGTYAAPPKYDEPGTRQLTIAAPSGSTPTARGEVHSGQGVFIGVWASTEFRSYPAPGGYVVEAFVTAQELGLSSFTPTANGTVGFDLGINVSYPALADAGTQGHRLGQYFFHVDTGPTGQPFQTVTAFCNPVLVAR